MYTDNGFQVKAFKTVEENNVITYSGYIENPYEPDHDPTSTSSLLITWDQKGNVFNLPNSFSIIHFIETILKNNSPKAI